MVAFEADRGVAVGCRGDGIAAQWIAYGYAEPGESGEGLALLPS